MRYIKHIFFILIMMGCFIAKVSAQTGGVIALGNNGDTTFFNSSPINKTDVESITFIPNTNVPSGSIGNWDASYNLDNSVIAYYMDSNSNNKYEVYIKSNGNIQAPEDARQLFRGFINMTALNGLEYLDTSNVKYMANMFQGCVSLRTIDISHFNTSKVETLQSLFAGNNTYGDMVLTNIIGIENIDTSNVTNMQTMFQRCVNLTTLDLSHFNTSKVTSFVNMFYGCSSLSNLNISSFVTTSATSMQGMFYNCSSLTTLDLSHFDTSSVTNFSGMFQKCTGLTALNIKSFNTSSANNMSIMFAQCSNLTVLDLTSFNTANVTNTQEMFNGCSNLVTIYAKETFITTQVSVSTNMFKNCTSLVGGLGTVFDSSYLGVSRAHLDGGVNNPGYFSGRGGILAEGNNEQAKFFNNSPINKTTVESITFEPYTGAPSGSIGSWDASLELDGSVMAYYKDANSNGKYEVYIRSAGKIMAPENSDYLFEYFTNMTSINGLEYLDTSNVTSMYLMFSRCTSLTTIDVSSFDTSNVTNMKSMFAGHSSVGPMILTSIIGLNNFNTSKVTDMSGMFYGCINLTTLNVSSFNTENVTSMRTMFASNSTLGTMALTNIVGIESFYTSKVTDMTAMFQRCSNLVTLDVSNFNTGSVTSMANMFYECSSLTSLNVSNFNTSNVEDMSGMFYKCAGLTTLDVSKWVTSKVKTMRNMFGGEQNNYNLMKLTTLDVSKWDTSNVEDMTCLFYGLGSLVHLDVSKWNVSKVTSFNHMFCDNVSLVSLDLSNWDTSSLKTVENMFDDCSSLETVGDISHWNTANLIDSFGMFNGCTSLEANGTIDLSGWNTTSLKACGEMFRAVPAKIIDLTGWTLPDITNDTWEGAGSGIYYSYGNMPESNYPGMSGMFLNAANLEKIYVTTAFVIPNNVNVTNMFQGAGVNGFTIRYKLTYKDLDYFEYYEANSSVLFKPFAREGYTLSGYKYNNVDYSLTTPFTMPASDIEIIANWVANSIEIENYDVDDTHLFAGEKLNINSFDLGLDNSYTTVIYDCNNTVKNSGYLFTGDIVKIYLNDSVVDEYVIVIKGDVNGDGKISSLDYVMIKNHIMGSPISGDAYLNAADMDSKDGIVPLDYVKIRKYIMG